MLQPPTPIDIPEIFRLICECLHSDKSTLSSLARTCQRFHEPAIDVLWFEVNGLHPLAKCLSSDVWEEVRDGNNVSLELKYPLLSLHCSRFIHYAKRVRNFSNDLVYGRQVVHRSVYEGLQVAMQEKLLPNVNDITWTCNNNTFPFIHMFLGPRITIIRYTYSAGSYAQTSMVAALKEKYPLLEHVDLSLLDDNTPPDWINRAYAIMSDSVYKWDQLKSLKVPTLTYAALTKLSQLRQLDTLEITSECKLDSHPPATDSRGFSKLAILDITGCVNASSLVSVINLLDGSPLRELGFYLNNIETPSSWEMVLKAISKRCSHKFLRKITCWDGHSTEFPNSDPIDMVTFEHIQHLLVFNDIEEIDIGFSKGFYISDAIMMEKMAMSWRRIRILKIDLLTDSRSQDRSKTTVLDLLPFAQHCPELRSLSLPFDATSPPEIDVDNPPWGGKGYVSLLNELLVGDSPIKSPILVAAALSAIFPSLWHITTIEQQESGFDVDDPEIEDIDGENHKAWKEVEKTLRAFTKVRKQERKFAQSHCSCGALGDPK